MGDAYNIPDELYHHGILGQKWYVRRFQNEDGTLTAEGRIRYGKSPRKAQYDLNNNDLRRAEALAYANKYTKRLKSAEKKIDSYRQKKGYGVNGNKNPGKGQDRKYDKLVDNVIKNTLAADFANIVAQERSKEAVKLVNNLENIGYSVIQSPTDRWALTRGQSAVTNMTGIMLGAASVIPNSLIYASAPLVEGTKYKVKRNTN